MFKLAKLSKNSIKFYALLAWLVPGTFAIVACIGVFFGTAFVEKRSMIASLKSELISKSQIVARRVSAEMLIGPRGSISSVTAALKKELNLSDIEVITNIQDCSAELANQSGCAKSYGSFVAAYYKVPFISEPYFVAVKSPVPNLTTFIKTSNLLWSTLPIALFLALGIFIQTFLLKRFIIRPIESLVDTTTGDKEPMPYWPREIREISERLFKSFKIRDEVLFTQITRGVIHDLKTLIHAPLGAIDLVNEQATDSEKRKARLEHMHAVVSKQLPKMQAIIDNTLDGSREIRVNLINQSVLIPIQGAVQTLAQLSEKTGVSIRVDAMNDLIAPHDHVQLERALTNLVKNGIEAAQLNESDKITKGVLLSARRAESFVEINVEDSGPGLPKVSPEKLFSALRSTKSHGSGLGLIVSKKIINSHGGKLMAGKSDGLGGAKFTIRLPLINREEQSRGTVC